jgi:hypothetical protein
MPRRTLRVCSVPGCPELTSTGKCEAYAKADRKPLKVAHSKRTSRDQPGGWNAR